MTPLISCKNLEQTFSGKPLFEGLDLSIAEGDRVGLIGSNGNGKTTLLKCIAGLHEMDGGTVTRRKGLKLSYITQSPEFDESLSVHTAAMQSLKSTHLSDSEKNVQTAIELSKAGFENFDITVKQLSGGWKKRLQIVCALAAEPDLMLLDEPTNHLDLKGVIWLEELLSQPSFTWVMVSHDRFFLENSVNRITELDKTYPGGVFSYKGGYHEFVKHKDEFIQSQVAYSQTLANKARKEDAWLARGAKARTTKAKGRIDHAHQIKADLSEVRSRLQKSTTNIHFSSSGRKTKKLIELKGVAKSLGDKLIFKDVDILLQPRQRLGILGDNGSGKTTLLKLLNKDHQHDSGKLVHANDLQIVYFDQYRETLDTNVTLKRALSEDGDTVIFQDRPIHVTSWAKRFRFEIKQLEAKVGDLSGGEKARVVIARLMLKPADVLLLDEPTNDLDITTREVLEQSLLDFGGCIALITHDRYMMTKICNAYIALDGEGNAEHYSSYAQWEKNFRSQAASSGASKNAETTNSKVGRSKKNDPKDTKRKKLTYIEQREYDSMESKIRAAEKRIAVHQSKVDDPEISTQPTKLNDAYKNLEKAQKEIENLYARWTELESKIQNLDLSS